MHATQCLAHHVFLFNESLCDAVWKLETG